jgi:peptide methionine sulfoxide reductase MsrA
LLQHLRAEAEASSQPVRTELLDATTGARIGYALGAQVESSDGALRACDAQLSDAQLLLVDEATVLYVPRGDRPPATVPLPAAPAIRRLLDRSPEWMGSATVITLAGGPSSTLAAALASLPGVLEATPGVTGRPLLALLGVTGRPAAHPSVTAEEACAEGLGFFVEAVQLAMDPSIELEVLLDAFWGAHEPTTARSVTSSTGGCDDTPVRQASCIFYHSAAQCEAAIASRERLQRTRMTQIMTTIRPATAFLEAP